MTSNASRPSDPTVLFVDDDSDQLDLYEHLFSREPVHVLTAPSGLHALEIIRTSSRPVVLLVSDYQMLGMNGIDLLNTVLKQWPKIGRILLTGIADAEIVLEAVGHKVLTKRMDRDLITRVILREAKRCHHAG